MKVLKNYKVLKKSIEEFPYIKIKDGEDVFLDLPICAIDYEQEIHTPVLYGDASGIPTVYEESEVLKIINETKLYHLELDGEKVKEVAKEDAHINIRLPKNTQVDELIYRDGELIWAKPIEEKESE